MHGNKHGFIEGPGGDDVLSFNMSDEQDAVVFASPMTIINKDRDVIYQYKENQQDLRKPKPESELSFNG